MPFSSRLRYCVMVAALAAVYFVIGKFSLMLATLHPNVSPVWPPAGLALAMLLLLGKRHWPAIFIGAFFVNEMTEGSIVTSFAIAAGNSLEAFAGCYLANRFAGGTKAFERIQTVVAFICVAILPSAIISATIGLGALVLGNFASAENFSTVWFTWWLGNVTGSMVVAPLIILWMNPQRALFSTTEMIESIALFTAMALVAGVTFSTLSFPYTYPSLFPILWIVIRREQREVALAVLLLSCIAIAGTLEGRGPFAGHPPNTSLLYLQSFIAIVSFMTLSFAATLQERKTFEQSLEFKVRERTRELARARNEDSAKLMQLRNVINQMTVATVSADEHMKVLHANKQFHELFDIDSPSLADQSLLHIFDRHRHVFLDPEQSTANILQLLGERRHVMNHEFPLKNGMILSCDYLPIVDEGAHRGHLLFFRSMTESGTSQVNIATLLHGTVLQSFAISQKE